jgi:hypothetical protein
MGAIVSARVSELEKALKLKNDKVKGYREIIIRLKDEFIKAEEERAVAEIAARTAAANSNAGGSGGPVSISAQELKELKGRITDLHDG